MAQDIKNEIENIISSFTQLPYLFIGTGFSIRYSTAPSWDKLLMDIWMIVNDGNESKYKKFVSQIAYEVKLDSSLLDEERKYYLNPQLATRIQKQFNDKFYANDDFEGRVFTEDEVDVLLDNNYDPFKFYIAKHTKDLIVLDEESRGECKELECLRKNQNKIAGVITTNYDLILKSIFVDFNVLVGQDNMLTANTNNIFEIFKIHGSADDPSSIVITQEDYSYFENKLKYLSAKLLTLFVEHPIIFIGYSVGDINIRNILKEIAECLNKKQLELVKSNFLFISPAFGEKEEIKSKEINFGDKRIIMTEIKIEDFSVLFRSLSIIKSSMPVKIMRKMQDMICNFIATTEATNNIMVGSINNASINDEQLGIYFGNIETVSEMGFDYYGIDDIIEDVLFDNKPYLMNKKLIDKTFKNIRSIAGKTYLPVYKYITGLGINKKSLPKEWNIINSLGDVKLTSNDKKYTKIEEEYHSIEQIEKKYPSYIPKQLSYILLNLRNIPEEELRDFLRKVYKDEESKKYISTIKKLVAAYDYIKYSGDLK